MREVHAKQDKIAQEAERILWFFLASASIWGVGLCYIWLTAWSV